MSSQGIPLILCGREEQIGARVIEGLKPEYDDEDGVSNIPRLLSGQPAQNTVSKLGSGNFSSTPVAIILGGGYRDENVKKFQDALAETPEARKVAWLRADVQRTRASGVAPGSAPYSGTIMARVKEMLDQLKAEGKLGGEDEGTYYY